MDMVKYEIFLDIIERGSYSKACEDLGYSLSGISKMMKSMEEEIDIPLITRTNKGISLTPDGEKVPVRSGLVAFLPYPLPGFLL